MTCPLGFQKLPLIYLFPYLFFSKYGERVEFTRAQHGLSPSGNLINMHKIGEIASLGFNSQLLEGIGTVNTRNAKLNLSYDI